MASTRRSFLSMMAASPLAAKSVAENASMQLMQGHGALVLRSGVEARGQPIPMPNRGPKDFARAFLDPKFKGAMEAAAFESNRHVSYIDHDIASKRSFSLAAKITFQRQRNVARELREYSEKRTYFYEVIESYFNPLGVLK